MKKYRTRLDDRGLAQAGSPTGPQAVRLVYVAVVHTRGTICHICAAPTAERLAVHLGEYVRENATYQLWPADAERVLALLQADRKQDAVALYFAAVGTRWDREELVVKQAGLKGDA